METIIIQGSSRNDGFTAETVERLNTYLQTDIINLLNHNIGYYNYNYDNQDDDFVTLSRHMLQAQKIIFATPIYWYAMSAPMKTFIDRWSDLVRIRKGEGHSMAGKEIYLLVNGGLEDLPDYFLQPFIHTASYMNMHYCGEHYVHTQGNTALKERNLQEIEAFAQKILTPCPNLMAAE